MWRSRMFWQMFGTYGGLILFAITLLGFVVTGRAQENELRQMEDNLRVKALLVEEVIRGRRGEDLRTLEDRLATLQGEIQTRILLIGPDNKIKADSARPLSEAPDQGTYGDTQETGLVRQDSGESIGRAPDDSLLYYQKPTDARPDVASIRLALPREVVRAQVDSLRRLIWTASALTAALALILAFWLARRITQPVQELIEGARQIAAGDYGHKVYAEGRDEVGVLAQTFNHMSERLASQFAQLDEDRQQLRAVLSSMVEGVVAIDAQQRILFANERAGHLLDFQTRNAVGRRLWEVVRQRPIQDVVQATLAQAQSHQQEVDWNGAPGRSLAVHAGPLPGSPPRGAVLVLHDTSALRRLERLRQEFVANVSHELKTPLAVIRACIETLIDGAVDDPEHRGSFLNQIADQADRLYALILDLLSLARIESETEPFSFQSVPLAKVISSCLERRRPLIEGKNLTLETVAPPAPGAGPVSVWADEEAVLQILDNLVDNAIKYTPAGGHIAVRWGVENGEAVLQVTDTGLGIAEQDLPRIFERFYRVDKARSREMGGTGLGLSIVKHLVQAMEGSVSASSQLGKGSTFTVRLPLARDE